MAKKFGHYELTETQQNAFMNAIKDAFGMEYNCDKMHFQSC